MPTTTIRVKGALTFFGTCSFLPICWALSYPNSSAKRIPLGLVLLPGGETVALQQQQAVRRFWECAGGRCATVLSSQTIPCERRHYQRNHQCRDMAVATTDPDRHGSAAWMLCWNRHPHRCG